MIDDGSHRYLDQDATLHTLWPRVREGGFYVIEDVVVGALPWDAAHAKQVPRTPTPTLTLTLNLTLTLTLSLTLPLPLAVHQVPRRACSARCSTPPSGASARRPT